MKLIRDVESFGRICRQYRRAGRTIGFVPTMGAFHEGHLSLMRQARAANDVVVVSLYVNPLQFAPGEDLKKYPRDMAADRRMADKEKVAVLFAPAEDFYPAGMASRVVVDAGLSEVGEGAARPGHFAGVCTVLARLFNLVGECRVYMGQKDYQQYLIVRRMVEDLAFPAQVVLCRIVRDEKGLALSSRNAYLDLRGKQQALSISAALKLARTLVELGERGAEKIRGEMLQQLREAGVDVEYIMIADAANLQATNRIKSGTLIAVTARVQGVRLLDNELFTEV